MFTMIDKVELDPIIPNVIIVTDLHGAQIRYLAKDGVLHPGRVWRSTSLEGHVITFFIPFPDGPPEILNVQVNDHG